MISCASTLPQARDARTFLLNPKLGRGRMKSHEVLKGVVESVGAKQVAHDLGVSTSLIYKWCEGPPENARDGSGTQRGW